MVPSECGIAMGTIQSECRHAKTAPGNRLRHCALALSKRAFAAPDFFNHTDVRVRDINDPQQSRQTKQQNDQRDCPGDRVPGRVCEVSKE